MPLNSNSQPSSIATQSLSVGDLASAKDREWYAALTDQIEWSPTPDRVLAGTLMAGAPGIPDWLRTATAGLLRWPDSRQPFSFARVWDPIDWPALLEEHPGELKPNLPVIDSLTWDGLARAFRLLVAAGYKPWLDAHLEVHAVLELCPFWLCCEQIDTATHPDLIREVTEALGGSISHDPIRHWDEELESWPLVDN